MDEANGLLPDDKLTLFCEVRYSFWKYIMNKHAFFVKREQSLGMLCKGLRASLLSHAITWESQKGYSDYCTCIVSEHDIHYKTHIFHVDGSQGWEAEE